MSAVRCGTKLGDPGKKVFELLGFLPTVALRYYSPPVPGARRGRSTVRAVVVDFVCFRTLDVDLELSILILGYEPYDITDYRLSVGRVPGLKGAVIALRWKVCCEA